MPVFEIHRCRVIAWEPVPHFRDFFKYAVAVNGFGHLIQARAAGS